MFLLYCYTKIFKISKYRWRSKFQAFQFKEKYQRDVNNRSTHLES